MSKAERESIVIRSMAMGFGTLNNSPTLKVGFSCTISPLAIDDAEKPLLRVAAVGENIPLRRIRRSVVCR